MTAPAWVAEIEFGTEEIPSNTVLQVMADEGEPQEHVVSGLGAAAGVRVLAYLDEPEGTSSPPLIRVAGLVDVLTAWVGSHLGDAAVLSVRVVTEQVLELEALTPSIPELASASDVAAQLGVSRQRVWQLVKRHPDFPAPIARVAAGPLWTSSAIGRFAASWERRAGRRRGAPATGEPRRATVAVAMQAFPRPRSAGPTTRTSTAIDSAPSRGN